MLKQRSLLLASAALACSVAGQAFATTPEIMQGISGLEADSRGYASCNCSNGNSALGGYGIIARNWVNHGYVTFPNGGNDWDTAVMTDRARAMGVNSVDDLLNTPSGHRLQDQMASGLAVEMWGSVSPQYRAMVGQTVNGVPLTEGSMMAATWMLGPGAMNTWAASGFTVDGLRNLPPETLQSYLDANGFETVEELQNHLMHRMAAMEGVDVSEIAEAVEDYLECGPEVSDGMRQEGAAYVDQMVAAAQNDLTGFSKLDEGFGVLSCIENAFNGFGGIDYMFSVPNLSGLIDQAMAAVCGRVNTMVSEATGELTNSLNSALSNVNSDGVGFGPFQGFGAFSATYNPNGSGFNYVGPVTGTGSGGGYSPASGGGGGYSPYSYNGSSGLDGLFE